jgi:hypothetical protein
LDAALGELARRDVGMPGFMDWFSDRATWN